MFNDKTNTKKRKYTVALTSATVLAMALTFGYATVADAQMKASVSKPVIRTEYKTTDIIDLSGSVSLQKGEQKISISLRDSDLKPALRMIADKAGLNIIFHNSVSGQVTLDLVNVTLNDAFKMIMQACDLSYVIDNETLIVLSKSASLDSDISKQNMMTIQVKYADASKVAEFLNNNVFSTNRPGLSNSKIAVTNPITNELILFGTQNDYKMAQKVLSKIDVAPKTVSFRINHTTPKEMATLVCQSLFPSATTGGGQSSSSSTSLGGGLDLPMPGMATGGASSSSNSSSSSSSSSSSGSSSSSSGSSDSSIETNIELGKGVVACTLKANNTDNKLKSLTDTALTVTYFPQKGTINVTGGSEYQAEMIKNFIQSNDKKQPQAFMEVQIVELSEDGSKIFNNSWHIMTPFFTGFFDGSLSNSNPMFFTGGPGVDAEGNPLTTFNRYHGKNTLGWVINYTIENGKGRILANPKVIVTNGTKSVIDLTSDYVKSVDEELMSTAVNNTEENGNTGYAPGTTRSYEIGDDLGISIEMTPFISPDGYVTLNLKPDYSTVWKEQESISVQGKPITAAVLLKRRNLELSNVRIKDGETLVIGGMIQEEETKDVKKVPLLGDLPVIGGAFRNTHTSNKKTELVIMVTPHIINDDENYVTETETL